MRGDSGTSERSGEIYLPYVGHLTEQAVLLRDGSVMAMGLPPARHSNWRSPRSAMRACAA
jgi:hypothetical protein